MRPLLLLGFEGFSVAHNLQVVRILTTKVELHLSRTFEDFERIGVQVVTWFKREALKKVIYCFAVGGWPSMS